MVALSGIEVVLNFAQALKKSSAPAGVSSNLPKPIELSNLKPSEVNTLPVLKLTAFG